MAKAIKTVDFVDLKMQLMEVKSLESISIGERNCQIWLLLIMICIPLVLNESGQETVDFKERIDA